MRGKELLECMEYIDDTLIEEALNPTIVSHKNKPVLKWSMAVACAATISAITFWSYQNANMNFNKEDIQMEHTDISTQANTIDSNMDKNDVGRLAVESGMTEMTEDALSTGTTSTTNNSPLVDAKSQSMEDKAAQKSNFAHWEAQEETESAYKVIREYYGEKESLEYCYSVPEKGAIHCYYYLQETINYYTTQENTTDITDSTIYAYQVAIDIYGDIETANGTQYEDLYHSNVGNLLIEQEYRRLIDLGYAVRLSEDFQLTGIFTKAEIDTFLTSPEYGYVFRFENES